MCVSLFISKSFALNKMFQQNASKFVIFFVLENLCFLFSATLHFYLMNALEIDQGIHKVKLLPEM